MNKWLLASLLLFVTAPAPAQVGSVIRRGNLYVHATQQPYTADTEPTVWVSVNSADPDVDRFDITIEYEKGGKRLTRTSTIQRARYTVNCWTTELFWVGEVKLISVRVQEYKPPQDFPMVPEN